MSLKTINNLEVSERIYNLNFLRGFFIFLALQQHFTYYINMWYVDYFRDTIALTSTYAVHFAMIGKQISSDQINHWFAYLFTPWVSQIYLTMAAFNLARKKGDDFNKSLPKRFLILFYIFLFFIVENLIVAPNTGQGISFYPIMLWMLVLGMLSLVYRFLGIKGVLFLTLFSLLRFVVPVEMISDFLEQVIRENIHPGYEYDARLEYFILSGCLGFIMGYVHYHMPLYKQNKDFLFMGFGVALIAIYALIGDPFIVYDNDYFRTEHDLAISFSGTAYILGIQALIISAFLYLEKKSIIFKFPLFQWIGTYSLMIFALHRILFVKLIAPFSIMVGSMTNRVLGASIVEIYIYIFITLGICFFLQKSNLLDVILQRRQ